MSLLYHMLGGFAIAVFCSQVIYRLAVWYMASPSVREIEQQDICPCGQVICNAYALMICNFCEIDDIQDFVLMICNASLRFALIVVCALGATLYVSSRNRTASYFVHSLRKWKSNYNCSQGSQAIYPDGRDIFTSQMRYIPDGMRYTALRCDICNAYALMICNFCEIDDIQDFVLMICNASFHFALIVVCALGATLYVSSINRTATYFVHSSRKWKSIL